MQSIPNEATIDRAGCAIRAGFPFDIEILNEIDVDAGMLFDRAGLCLDFEKDHEFALAERNRWLRCLAEGTVLIAVDHSHQDVGFAAVGLLDGEPYLDQLSVRLRSMGRGIGTELLDCSERLMRRAGGGALWLTTYSHLSWNRPFYERRGFVVVPPGQVGVELTRELHYQQRWLPMPEQRVVMRKDITQHSSDSSNERVTRPEV